MIPHLRRPAVFFVLSVTCALACLAAAAPVPPAEPMGPGLFGFPAAQSAAEQALEHRFDAAAQSRRPSIPGSSGCRRRPTRSAHRTTRRTPSSFATSSNEWGWDAHIESSSRCIRR